MGRSSSVTEKEAEWRRGMTRLSLGNGVEARLHRLSKGKLKRKAKDLKKKNCAQGFKFVEDKSRHAQRTVIQLLEQSTEETEEHQSHNCCLRTYVQIQKASSKK